MHSITTIQREIEELENMLKNNIHQNQNYEKVFLIDISDSMAGDKLETAKRALNDVAKDDDLIIAFGETVHKFVKKNINTLLTKGDTAMLPALKEAVNLRCKRMILITDGLPNNGGNELDVIDFVQRINGIQIDTIAIDIENSGYWGEETNFMFLEKISEITGGKNLKSTDLKKLYGDIKLLAEPQTISL